jgi:hypothetical protein
MGLAGCLLSRVTLNMPAQNLLRINKEGVYCHIYNRGIENKIIFGDEQDYEVFLNYLRDSLSPPINPTSIKKEFSINGRTFQGVPHLPKNFFGQVVVIAYGLMPDHFHIIVYQTTKNSLEKFIRSLCTRYSMYFNKKYKRTGPLFHGPYKSVQIENETGLLYLTRYLHTCGHSSYGEFLGEKVTPWVRPEIVVSFFNKAKNDSLKGVGSYKDFVEKYEPDPKEKEYLQGVILESESHHLENRVPAKNIETPPEIPANPNLKPWQRIPELLAASGMFLLLVGLGLRSISASAIKIISQPLPTPAVLPESVELEEEAETIPKTILTVKIDDDSKSVGIHRQPTEDSDKIGEAKSAETFEYVSLDSGWYEIKLADGTSGFISSKYIEVVQEK